VCVWGGGGHLKGVPATWVQLPFNGAGSPSGHTHGCNAVAPPAGPPVDPYNMVGSVWLRESLSTAFSVWTQCTVPIGKRQWVLERNAIGHTHGSASSAAKV
jgi:hypothetical protein